MATATERLAKVRAAIDEILDTGQAVSADGRALTMASLRDLREMEKDLKAEIAASATRARVRYVRPCV
jgi:hypothetical protein